MEELKKLKFNLTYSSDVYTIQIKTQTGTGSEYAYGN